MSEFISAAKDIALGVSAAVTATAAWLGVQSWKKELRGKAEFEVARKYLVSVIKLRNAIQACRSPLIRSAEFPDDYDLSVRAGNTSTQDGDAYLHVYKNRFQPVSEAQAEFEALAVEAEALWGQGIREKSKQLRMCVIDLHTAIEMRISDLYSGEHKYGHHDKIKHALDLKLSASPDSDDELSMKVRNAVSYIEEAVRPHLSRA